ncbi:uncharacterized protein LOC130957084 [Arachis stenosperma]|uniref:uncharacterized protein LOC130957084 n=1 Tax=Arachis stenosperma TaxID=217475 RepID=UPI0025ABDD8D|nr:uncharacterized protein LOC130957084 [Arachis stenosperma]
MDGESLYEAWKRYKALIRKCPPEMFNEWDRLQNFCEGLTLKAQEALDYSTGGSVQLMKTAEEAQNLINTVANNQYFYAYKRQRQPAQRKGVLELEGVDNILAQNKVMHQQIQQQMKMMAKRIDGLQIAAVNTTIQPSPTWGQNEESYEEQQPKQVNYMHNQGAGQNEFHGDTYNPSWRNHPNLRWGENQNQQSWQRNSNQNYSLKDNKASSKKEMATEEKDQEKLKEKEEEPQASKKGKKVMDEQSQEQRKMVKPYTPPSPYPQRLQKELKDQQFPKFLEVFKKLEINIPLAEALQ